MTADQSGGQRPSFEDLIQGHLNPLIQQDAARRRVVGDIREIAANTGEDLAETERQRYLETQAGLDSLLQKFGVLDKLQYVRRNVWRRRGSIEPFEVPLMVNDRANRIYINRRL